VKLFINYYLIIFYDLIKIYEKNIKIIFIFLIWLISLILNVILYFWYYNIWQFINYENLIINNNNEKDSKNIFPKIELPDELKKKLINNLSLKTYEDFEKAMVNRDLTTIVNWLKIKWFTDSEIKQIILKLP